MSHVFRFLAMQRDEATWVLSEDESRHLVKVLRLGAGTAVEVTDGKGLWAEGRVADADARAATVETGAARREGAPEIGLVVCLGALKPGDVDDVLPALVELGMDEVHVFLQEDNAKARLQPKVIERWTRILQSAMKQSKRARLPELRTHASLAELATSLGGAATGDARLVLDAAGEWTLTRALAEREIPRGSKVTALVGAEKGLTPSELKVLAAAGFTAVRLGPHILRAVTAVVAAGTALSLYRADRPVAL